MIWIISLVICTQRINRNDLDCIIGYQGQPRALEIDPRDPYRRFPNELRVEYGANPARVSTPRYRRFDNYKEATTIGGARRLGATSQDLSLDIQAPPVIPC